MSEVTTMRKSLNQVNIEGYVNSNNLVLKTDKVGKELITGSIDIIVGESNIIPVEVFSYKLKKDGTENKIYKSLVTVMNEYKDSTMVDGGYINADKVNVSGGEIRVNEFLTKEKTVAVAVKYNTNFLNRSDAEAFAPKANFKIEMIVTSLRGEVKDEEDTGRGLIGGYYVDYNGDLQPITLVANAKNWSKMEDKIEKGSTIIFWGDIVNFLKTETITVEADFGDDQEYIRTRVTKERLITGAKIQDDDKAYNIDDIKAGIARHAEKIEQLMTTPRINEQLPPTTETETKVETKEEKFEWE